MVGLPRAKTRQPNDSRGSRTFDSVALWPPVANPIEFKRLSAIGIVGVAATIAKCDLSRDGEPTRVCALPLTLAAVLGKDPLCQSAPESGGRLRLQSVGR